MPRRHRRRHPPSYFRRFVALVRRNPVRSITAALVILGGIVPAVKGIQYIDDATDLFQPALHRFVYDQVGTIDKKITTVGAQNQNILRDLQIDTATGKRAATINELKRWQVELEKSGHDQRTTDLITQQIDALQATKDKLDAQLKTLNEIKGQ